MTIYPDIQLFTITARFTGDAGAVFPAMVRVDSIVIPYASALVGVQLSGQISSANTGAFFVVVGPAPKYLSVTPSLQAVAHYVATAAAAGVIDEFADLRDCPVYIPAGSPVSLYASDPGPVAMLALVNLQIARVTP